MIFLEMMMMNDPISKAKWVLASKEISGVPAQSLGLIADSEGIKRISKDYPDDVWDGALIYKGKKRAIIINEHRGSTQRHNFTFAHELGHYFLEHAPTHDENGKRQIRCTAQDIAKGSKRIEAEANHFAVELLMPEERFRLSMAGAAMDFALINGLATEYQVSKEACAYRILEFIREPCAVIFTKDGAHVRSMKTSRAGKGLLPQLQELPEESIAYSTIQDNRWQQNFEECLSRLWLTKQQDCSVYSCTRGNFNHAMTILRWS